MTLHVESLGAGDDLILLHGWGMHGGVWEAVQSELARSFRVHVVDLPGLGYSSTCAPYTLENIASLLAEAFPQQVYVCGWSLGGQVAMRWALAFPSQVKRLVLVGATPRFVSSDDWDYGVADEVFQQFAQQVAQDYRGTLMRFLSLQAHGGTSSREQAKQLREHFFARGEPAPDVLQAGLRILLETDLRNVVSGLEQPVLLVHGGRDTLAPSAAATWMAETVPDARLKIIEKAAHAPFISHPSDFVHAVQSFLELH